MAVAIAENISRIPVKVGDKTSDINVFFHQGCREVLFKSTTEGNDYRCAFIDAVYYMMEKGTGNLSWKRDEFADIDENELRKILNEILNNQVHTREEYHRISERNPYKRFYDANYNILNREIEQETRIIEAITQNLEKNITDVEANSLDDDAHLFHKMYNGDPKAVSAEVIESRIGISPIAANVAYADEKIRLDLQKKINDLDAILGTWFDLINRTITQNARQEDDYKKVFDLGWTITEDCYRIIFQDSAEINEKTVKNRILGHFRDNEWAALKTLVGKWYDIPYFRKRELIFQEALEVHKHHFYNSSVTLLVLNMEGVISEFVIRNLGINGHDLKRVMKELEGKVSSSDTMDDEKRTLYLRLTSIVEKIIRTHFDKTNPELASNFSRDRIAHGYAYEREDEISSLKCFLWIDQLHSLLLEIDGTFSKTFA